MRKTTLSPYLFLAVAAAALTSARPTMFAQTSTTPAPETRAPAAQVFLTNSQLDPNENYQVVRAFVKTGSLDPNCLVTLGDTTFVVNGTLVFCAPRQPDNLGKGIMISIFYPVPPPDGFSVSATLFQQSAKKYGPPVLCDVSGC
jgi:hypothetical protein